VEIGEKESAMNKLRTFAWLAVAMLAMAASIPALAGGGSHGGSHGAYYGGGAYGKYYGGSYGKHYGGYHGGHYGYPGVSVGFVFGAPGYWGYPGYYPPPYYYYPQAVAVPVEPPVYVERGDAYASSGPSQGYWYYCPEAKAYYPYVKYCAGGWQRVSPTPPG
jgi:hypothetical protein